jgi:Thoeris protein ThsB, TIR-like domain
MERHVFLNFQKEDEEYVRLYRGQAFNSNNSLELNDYSVKEPFESSDAEYTRHEIIQLLNQVSVNVCLIGSTNYSSKWVN